MSTPKGCQLPSMERRKFIGKTGLALSAGTAFNTMLSLEMACAAMANQESLPKDDYKALVCILLHGGNDSFNMLIPTSEKEYGYYKKSRGNIALPISGQSAALPLQKADTAEREFSVHPSMPEVKNLFDIGRLGFIANVGTLVEPTSLAQYQNKSVVLPRALFSHNDQRDQWQTAFPQADSSSGWLGRANEQVTNAGSSSRLSNSFSLSGNNLIQVGAAGLPYCINATGSVGIDVPWMEEIFKSTSNQLENNGINFNRRLADITKQSIENERVFTDAFSSMTIDTPFPQDNVLAESLKSVARVISSHAALKQKRQTFYVVMEGWDLHQDLLEKHAYLLNELSGALFAFNKALDEVGLADDVTTFTISDIGRALSSNGRGSDHGWGGNQMVMGGAVNGGRVFGQYPEALLLGDGLDVGTNGRILPDTSNDEYFNDLLTWFGVSRENMSEALPNIDRFISANSKRHSLNIFKES